MKKADRVKIWEKYDKHCAYCGKLLDYPDMQVDHIIPRRGGRCPSAENMENMNPSCRQCNHYKRSHSLKRFRQLVRTLDKRVKAHYINKVAVDYGIIIEAKPWDGVFYFERCLKIKGN